MRLFIVQDLVERCFESAEKLVEQEVQIELVFSEDVLEAPISLLYAKSSQIYYLPMRFLEAISQELELLPYDLEEVIIDDEEVEIFLASAEGISSWTELLDKARQSQNLPQASFLEAKAKPLSTMTWELFGGAGAWVDDLGGGQGGLTHIYILAEAESGAVFGMKMVTEALTRQDLVDLVTQAVVYPMGDPSQAQAKRPARIYTADVALMELLYEPMQALGVGVKLAETPMAQEAFEHLLNHMGVDQFPNFFARYDEADLKSFFKAADGFFELEPWERLSGHKYIAFQINDGDWHYCNVMGQEGEEFGLAMFGSWLELCRFVHNQPAPLQMMMGAGVDKQVRAAGGVESLSLHEAGDLNPEDIAYLQNLGLNRDSYPIAMRFTLEGLETPRFSLVEYQTLLQGLAEVLASRKATQISSIKKTLDSGGNRLELRYPAKGTEALPEKPASYRLTVNANPMNEGRKLPKVKNELVIEATGDTSLYKLVSQIRDFLGEFYISGFGFGFESSQAIPETDANEKNPLAAFLGSMSDDMGTLFWSERGDGRYGPHPCLAQLEGQTDLWLESGMIYYPAKLERLEDAVSPNADIKLSKH